MIENLITIETLSELKALQEYLVDKDITSFDIETVDLREDTEIIGFSVATEIDTGYYVILSYWDVATQSIISLETKEGAKSFFQSLVGKSLIMQNAPFDCARVRRSYGVDLMPSVHTDTLCLGHLLNENRINGLKERGVELYGEDERAEQIAMKESVAKNGGQLTKTCYELYKGDRYLIAHYGAKDAILTLKVFYNDVPILFDEGLDKFFYEEETMPLLRGPTYDMNTTGLKVDLVALADLKRSLEIECLELKAFVEKEIKPHVADKYPGTSKAKIFNIGSTQQLSWLVFSKLECDFNLLTKAGKLLCKALDLKIPYTPGDKREFIRIVEENKGKIWAEEGWNHKTKKKIKPKKVGDPWKYLSCGRESLEKHSHRYKWMQKLLEYAKAKKLLSTYVIGIGDRVKYGIIHPDFKQCGTTSGRYACRNPNFQNLPRDDKRVKACVVARPGKVFVGADFSQLEPRVFASQSQDFSLLKCFENGDDFYSAVGAPIFHKEGLSLKKDDKNGFAKLFPKLRQDSKPVALAIPYGGTAFQLSRSMGKSPDECQEIITNYLESFPGVHKWMLESYEQVKTEGKTYNQFGRPRRQPAALEIKKIYGNTQHADLPYNIRNMLNLAVNHRVQSTGASIMNRAAIATWKGIRAKAETDPRWYEVKIILQVHDELILEGPIALAEEMAALLNHCMENTVELPGVALVAEPAIAYKIADLK